MSISKCVLGIKYIHPREWVGGALALIGVAAVIIGALGLLLGGKLGAIGAIGNRCLVGFGTGLFVGGSLLFILGCRRAHFMVNIAKPLKAWNF